MSILSGNFLKKKLKRTICSFIIFLVVLFYMPVSVRADTGTVLTYQVYAGGIHVIQSELELSFNKSDYTAKLISSTLGFLGRMVPWHGSFVTKGQKITGEFFPLKHQSISTWKGKDDQATYNYDRQGQFKSLKLIDGDVDKTPEKIDPALTRDTVDVLTATLRVLQKAESTGKCQGKSDVFDSRRRFTLSYQSLGNENLKPTRYGFYHGSAMKCTVEVIPKGGAWKKKPRGWLSIQEQGRKNGALPTLWLASIDPNLSPVPVRILIKTNYGTLVLHLSSARIGGKVYAIP